MWCSSPEGDCEKVGTFRGPKSTNPKAERQCPLPFGWPSGRLLDKRPHVHYLKSFPHHLLGCLSRKTMWTGKIWTVWGMTYPQQPGFARDVRRPRSIAWRTRTLPAATATRLDPRLPGGVRRPWSYSKAWLLSHENSLRDCCIRGSWTRVVEQGC